MRVLAWGVVIVIVCASTNANADTLYRVRDASCKVLVRGSAGGSWVSLSSPLSPGTLVRGKPSPTRPSAVVFKKESGDDTEYAATKSCLLEDLGRAPASTGELGTWGSMSALPARVLGGHAFLGSLNYMSAFPTTDIGISLGGGFSNTTTTYTSGGESSTGKPLSLGAFRPTIRIQKSLFDNWALGVEGGGSVTAGLSSSGALDYGAAGGYDYSLHVLYQFHRDTNWAVSAYWSTGKAQDYRVYPKGVLEAVLPAINKVSEAGTQAALKVLAKGFLRKDTYLKYGPGFVTSLALNSVFGITAEAAYLFRADLDPDGVVDPTGNVSLSSALSVDLRPGIGIPIGTALAWQRTGLRGGANTWVLGLYETDSPKFNIGIDVSMSTQKSKSEISSGIFMEDKDTVFTGAITTRYYY